MKHQHHLIQYLNQRNQKEHLKLELIPQRGLETTEPLQSKLS